MENNIREMRVRHKREISELQIHCLHPDTKITNTTFEKHVICIDCGKLLKRERRYNHMPQGELTDTECVRVIMEGLGWCFCLEPMRTAPVPLDMTTRWCKDGETPISPEQALAKCQDLSELAKVLKQHGLGMMFIFKDNSAYITNSIGDMVTDWIQKQTTELAAMFTTAEALRAIK